MLRAERRRAERAKKAQLEVELETVLGERRDPLCRVLSASPQLKQSIDHNPSCRALIQHVKSRAPRLMVDEYIPALVHISKLAWHRLIEDWSPRGKGRRALFHSLCVHLLARYRTPGLLWSAFTHPDAGRMTYTVASIAEGKSLFSLVKDGIFPIPLTKRQCHLALHSSGEDFLRSVRAAQFSELEGNRRVFREWTQHPIGMRLHARVDEEFYFSFVRLCASTPFFDPTLFGPLVDYVQHAQRADRKWSLKGRTVSSLLRKMEEWHTELRTRRATATYPKTFAPSGFNSALFSYSTSDHDITVGRKTVFRISEILTSKDLFQEGAKQKHCVFSYGYAIVRGVTSIWSMTVNEGAGPERVLTIEVRNREKSVVQMRGQRNRAATVKERRIVTRWASENGLSLSPWA